MSRSEGGAPPFSGVASRAPSVAGNLTYDAERRAGGPVAICRGFALVVRDKIRDREVSRAWRGWGMHPGQWAGQRIGIACAVLIGCANAAVLTKPRNICFFCRICTSPKPIPPNVVAIEVITSCVFSNTSNLSVKPDRAAGLFQIRSTTPTKNGPTPGSLSGSRGGPPGSASPRWRRAPGRAAVPCSVLPLLQAAEGLHVRKHTAFGFGAITLSDTGGALTGACPRGLRPPRES
jgi:hypothetical protein